MQTFRFDQHRVTDRGPVWSARLLNGGAGPDDLGPIWRELLAGAATETLFLQPEWVLPWLELYGRRLRPLVAFEHGRPRAGALLVAERLGPRGAGLRLLRPPGLGVSDYLDLLLPGSQASAKAALEVMLDGLVRVGGWDLLDLPNLPDEWPTAELVAAWAQRRGLGLARLATHRRPYLVLDGAWEEFLGSRPRKLRYNLRARRRHLEALGTLCTCHYTRPDEVARQLPRAVALHARRWAGQRTGTTFSSSQTARRFYAAAAGRLAAVGQLDLSTLELDGRLLAFALCFVQRDKLYYYLPAFDPDFGRYAPSTLLLADVIQSAYSRGLRELDFMLGEEPYKEQWATGVRGTSRLLLAAPGVRGAGALAAFRAYLTARERARHSALLQRVRRYGLRGLLNARA